MQGYFIKNIGQNRGKPRIWLENLEVSTADFKPGDRYDVRVKGGVISLQANPDGSRIVSSKTGKRTGESVPIIDINSRELLALFEGMNAIRLVQRKGEIYLLPLATEIKKKQRLNRLRHKLNNDIPLTMGSLSHGMGLLSMGTKEGLNSAGIRVEKGITNEIRGELLELASEGQSWDKSAIPVAAPMQAFAFDQAAMRHVGQHDVVELGLPCSGASVSGRARRATKVAEAHPEVGHLVVAALMIIAQMNPAALVFENVIPYSSTASASILRNQLRDLGYVTHERVLAGSDFNALEDRKRWCMVAVTEGMHFDWDMLQLPAKRDMTLSDIMDDIPEDSPLWSEMRGLKAKQERDIAEGKGFLMQVFGPEDRKISCLTKGYSKVRSTDAKIRHPSDPDLLRQVTVAEHARVKQWPPHLFDGIAKTIAHEILGQGVQKDPFVAAAKLLGESLLDYAQNGSKLSRSEFVHVIQQGIEDTASMMVVSEIRAPQPGVIYEGPVTVNDIGVIIQDIGNGVGILHKASAFDSVKLGETLQVKYPGKSALPEIHHLDTPAPHQTAELIEAQRAAALEGAQQSSDQQMTMFNQPAEQERQRPYSGPRM